MRAATKGLLHRVGYDGEPTFATRNWPYYVRYWLPSIDYLADTATFHFNLSVPRSAVAAANGALGEWRVAALKIPLVLALMAFGDLNGIYRPRFQSTASVW